MPHTGDSRDTRLVTATRTAAVSSCALLIALAAQSPAPAPQRAAIGQRATGGQLASIQKYIHETGHTLTRVPGGRFNEMYGGNAGPGARQD